MSALPPAPPRRRYLCLDHWRGLICLYIVLEHASVALWGGLGEVSGPEGWLRWGIVVPLTTNVGTHLFFVISAYCLASSTDPAKGKVRSAAGYLGKRFWRIFPPYWAALAVFVGLVALLDANDLERWHRSGLALELDSPRSLDLHQWLGNLTLTETWRPLLAGPKASVFTRVGWSLCIQEQLYLLAALLLAAFPRRFGRALATTAFALLGLVLVSWDSGASHHFEGTLLAHWAEFAVGLGLYWRLNRPLARPTRAGFDLGLGGLAALALAAGNGALAASAGFGLLLAGLYRWDDALAASAWLAPLRSVGRRSYSIYLMHLPFGILVAAALDALGLQGFWPRVFVLMPLAASTALAAGWVFYESVESRFLAPPRALRPAADGRARPPATPALGAGALATGH
jgi:peptidoglycan/LPS O-acetylase OafA/YrhL